MTFVATINYTTIGKELGHKGFEMLEVERMIIRTDHNTLRTNVGLLISTCDRKWLRIQPLNKIENERPTSIESQVSYENSILILIVSKVRVGRLRKGFRIMDTSIMSLARARRTIDPNKLHSRIES